MTTVIEAQGLERSFGDLKAVAGIDLAVEEGEVFGFLGPNGAGKINGRAHVHYLAAPHRRDGSSSRI